MNSNSKLDIELACAGPSVVLGKPTMKVVVDRYSRVVLGYYVTEFSGKNPDEDDSCPYVLLDYSQPSVDALKA